MPDNITASVGDQAGIPDGTTYATKWNGLAHEPTMTLGLGYVNLDDDWVDLGMAGGTHDFPGGPIIQPDIYTETQDSIQVQSAAHKGAILWLDVSDDAGGAETLSLEIWGVDPVSTNFVKLYSFGVVGVATQIATYASMIYPGALDADYAGKALSGSLPYAWFVKVVHSSTGSWTYSLGVTLLK